MNVNMLALVTSHVAQPIQAEHPMIVNCRGYEFIVTFVRGYGIEVSPSRNGDALGSVWADPSSSTGYRIFRNVDGDWVGCEECDASLWDAYRDVFNAYKVPVLI